MSIAEAERWLSEHGNALYAFALLHLRNPHLAEDAVQETLLAALQAQARYTGSASVRTWLTGILKHKIIDEFRRAARETANTDSAEVNWEHAEAERVEQEFEADGHWNHALSDWGNPEKQAYSEQLWSLIERCLNTLSPRAARLFVLRDLWEMEAERVCQELAITPNNLWTGLHRARLGMRQCLEKNGMG
jgi:RNA polymerase sigma-70 factor (ECF subfamily)